MRITVRFGSDAPSAYDVLVGAGIVEELPTLLSGLLEVDRIAVISDSTVGPLHGERVAAGLRAARLRTDLFTFPAGEEQKTREWWSRLTDALLAEGFGRDGAVVAVGGGVVGDMAGFVAATYMRGIPVVQVPTSLVAMIDSAVGGKTGVDHPQGKNLIGAFHPPRLVLIDPVLIGTLPRPERSQGLAEALKHGAIRDREYLFALDSEADALLSGEVVAIERAVRRSVRIKADVVSRDERESGLRQILNFGHTLGHALEAATDYRLPHGSAVAVGMVLEARLGERLGITEAGAAELISTSLQRLELPTEMPVRVPPERVTHFLGADKKVRGGRPGFVLLGRLGEVHPGEGWVHRVAEKDVALLLSEAL